MLKPRTRGFATVLGVSSGSRLRSTTHHGKTYIGLTDDVPKRLLEHNQGNTSFTSKYRPWKLVVEIRFSDSARAESFEEYLKTGSGRAFAKKHLW